MDRLIKTWNKRETQQPQQSSHPRHCNYFPRIHHWKPASRKLLIKTLTPSSLIPFLRKVERRTVMRQSQQAIPRPTIIPITESITRHPQPSAFQMDPWKKSLPIWTRLSLVKYTILNTLYMIKTLTSKQHMAHDKTFTPSPSIFCATSISVVQTFCSPILHRRRKVESCIQNPASSIRILHPASLLLLL